MRREKSRVGYKLEISPKLEAPGLSAYIADQYVKREQALYQDSVLLL